MFKVESFSRPGVIHNVWQDRRGIWRCDCEYYQFNGYKKGECDHIRKVRKQRFQYGNRSLKDQRRIKKERLERQLDRAVQKHEKLINEPFVTDKKRTRLEKDIKLVSRTVKSLENKISKIKL